MRQTAVELAALSMHESETEHYATEVMVGYPRAMVTLWR
jgi:hypothetical protein